MMPATPSGGFCRTTNPVAFRTTIPRSFKTRLQAKSTEQQGAILRCIDWLAKNPRHPGLRTRKVQGAPGEWEARADRGSRVTWRYGEEPRTIVLLNHCTHKQVLGR